VRKAGIPRRLTLFKKKQPSTQSAIYPYSLRWLILLGRLYDLLHNVDTNVLQQSRMLSTAKSM